MNSQRAGLIILFCACLVLACLADRYRTQRNMARSQVSMYEITLEFIHAGNAHINATMAARGAEHDQIQRLREDTRQETRQARQEQGFQVWADYPLPVRVQSGGLLNKSARALPCAAGNTGGPDQAALCTPVAGQN